MLGKVGFPLGVQVQPKSIGLLTVLPLRVLWLLVGWSIGVDSGSWLLFLPVGWTPSTIWLAWHALLATAIVKVIIQLHQFSSGCDQLGLVALELYWDQMGDGIKACIGSCVEGNLACSSWLNLDHPLGSCAPLASHPITMSCLSIAFMSHGCCIQCC